MLGSGPFILVVTLVLASKIEKKWWFSLFLPLWCLALRTRVVKLRAWSPSVTVTRERLSISYVSIGQNYHVFFSTNQKGKLSRRAPPVFPRFHAVSFMISFSVTIRLLLELFCKYRFCWFCLSVWFEEKMNFPGLVFWKSQITVNALVENDDD